MTHMQGVVIGIVKDLNDPNGEGRIQVEYPWLPGSPRSPWAPIAVALAGGNRGMYFMPEIDDEALVAFEHGDFAHPFIVGFLWNGVDKPPTESIDTHVRRIKTVSGHIMDFDDREGQKKIVITTQGGQKVEMNDEPNKSITIWTAESGHKVVMDTAPGSGSIHIDTAGQSQIHMDDEPTKSITIKTPGTNEVKISDVPGSVEIKAGATQVNVKALPLPTVELKTATSEISVTDVMVKVKSTAILQLECVMAMVTASALLNCTAPMVVFSGTVVAPTLISSSIVSPTYTPGAGNLFGL